ncbi:MAG: S24/S26 family peptidase [Deltaproteobacteria bacterium]|nr:S24/S26 family peptidase [Deltaproteobacteria bacterium]
MRREDLTALIREVVGRGGHLEIAAVGLSMAPAIQPGDKLVLGPLHHEEPRPGQIVLVAREGSLLAHRVVEVGARITARGDACDADDPPFTRSEILAVVRSLHTPLLQRARRLLRSARG